MSENNLKPWADWPRRHPLHPFKAVVSGGSAAQAAGRREPCEEARPQGCGLGGSELVPPGGTESQAPGLRTPPLPSRGGWLVPGGHHLPQVYRSLYRANHHWSTGSCLLKDKEAFPGESRGKGSPRAWATTRPLTHSPLPPYCPPRPPPLGLCT